MLGSITRDPIFCSKARIQKYFFQVIDDYEKITGRCILWIKKRRSCGSNEGSVKFVSTQEFVLLKKVKFHWDWI
jgi:hypothetical protein